MSPELFAQRKKCEKRSRLAILLQWRYGDVMKTDTVFLVLSAIFGAILVIIG